MMKMKNTLNVETDNLNLEIIPRCIKCYLICLLKLNYKDGKPFINYECENGHQGNILLKEYLNKLNKFSILKEKCNDCKKNQKEIKREFKYCFKCNKFICSSCILNHQNGDKHFIMNLKKYDSLCKKHSNIYNSYCVDCKKNLCIYCKSNHKNHNSFDLSKVNYSKEYINKLKEQIKSLENKIKNIDIIKEKIILEINKLKESNELEIKFFKILLYSYEQKNLNYNIIQNLKDFENKYNSNKYEKIYEEGNKYIFILQNLNYKSSSFKNNFKILQNHRNSVYYLSSLSDGRLISCSRDKTINIYKKDSYELQLSIKEHSDFIYSFTQLKDGRLISCSADKTMKIIKLIDDNKYQIDQTLIGHNNNVCKVIEIKKNELISVSTDKTMKIWKLNNKNSFENILTINFQNSESDCNILKINKNEFVTSSYENECLKFWNSNNYSNIININNIENSYTQINMCLLKENLLCVGGKGFYLIKLPNHQLIKNIIRPKVIYSINKCLDGLILCSIIDENKNNCLIKYKYEEENLIKIVEKEKAHNKFIFSCIELNDGTIASGGIRDYSIKLWKD